MKLHYKNILTYAFSIFFIISCNVQKNEKNVKDTKINGVTKNIKTMKKLDKIKLEKYKKDNQFKYIESDSIFKLEDHGEKYKEIKNKIGERLTTINVYDKDKLVLIGNGNYMFDFPIGIHRDYDLDGNIIQEKNFDKDFPLSFRELKQKLLNEAKINIDDTTIDLSMNRGLDSSDMKHKYYLTLYAKDRTSYRYIIIDGVTGNILKDLNVRALD
jgi:hypothetical protein